VFDDFGVVVCVGYYCVWPLYCCYGVVVMIRVSFGLYNIIDEIGVLVCGFDYVRSVFGMVG